MMSWFWFSGSSGLTGQVTVVPCGGKQPTAVMSTLSRNVAVDVAGSYVTVRLFTSPAAAVYVVSPASLRMVDAAATPWNPSPIATASTAV